MRQIHLGDVSIPVDVFATAANALVGVRDCGKTVTGKVICEQLIDLGVHPIIFDAVGKWRHLKSPGSGPNGKGYKVVVAGGKQPDLPLNPQSVGEIVRAALKERIPLVIDLYSPDLNKTDWRNIVREAIRIIHYENEGAACHVILEEASEYVPQNIYDKQVYSEVEKLVRMGGNASVGITMICQRAEQINKEVLEQCSNLILGTQFGKNSINNLKKWLELLSQDDSKKIVDKLPRLKAGNHFIWTSLNPDRPYEVQVPMCRSFHPDRRTPQAVLTKLKPADTSEFVERLSKTIPTVVEEAKANDPKELKKRIIELERQLNKPVKVAEPAVKEVEVPALSIDERKRLECLIESFDEQQGRMACITDRMVAINDMLVETRAFISTNSAHIRFFQTMLQSRLAPPPRAAVGNNVVRSRPAAPVHNRPVPAKSNGDIAPVERRILNAIAELELIGVKKPVREMVALMAGYTNLASTGYVKAIGALRTAGMVEYPDADTIQLNLLGQQHADYPDAPRSSEEIQQRVCSILGGKAREILEPLIAAYPSSMPRMEVANAAGYTNLASTGFVKIIGRLRTLGFIDYPDSQTMVATDVLFLK